VSERLRDRFRAAFESFLGEPLDSSQVEEVARGAGIDITDPDAVAEFERRLQGMGEVPTSRLEDDPFIVVEPVFQQVVERVRNIFDPDVLARYSAPIRMLIATRLIDGQVDNGGWPAVFYNEALGLLPEAIQGYRLLGLGEHAALAERIQAHGWTQPTDNRPDDPAWGTFDAEWFALDDVEAARARYIRGHPADFGLEEDRTSVTEQ
jgi:hypothetical protein